LTLLAFFKCSLKSLAAWRTYLKDNAPLTNGYKVTNGLSWKNNTMYIGRAYGSASEIVPGRIQLESTIGVYIPYGSEVEKIEEIEYMVVPKGCVCTWEDPAMALTRVGIVRLPNNDYVIGIKTIGTNMSSIARVSSSTKQQWWMNSGGSQSTDSAPEKLLVCENVDYTTTPAPTPPPTPGNF
jgi:hypothetical protein